MAFTVRVPATSANLGPGFDCLGLALDLWATVRVEKDDGRPQSKAPALHLVLQGVRAAFEGSGRRMPRVWLDWDAAIPLARGLGASAALRAGGLLAGNAMLGGALDADALLAKAAALEGHADNVAPALFGGLQVVVRAEKDLVHAGAAVPGGLRVVLFVPDFEMPTQESRRRLPEQLARDDVVFNTSRVALLLAALAGGRADLLDEATRDRIHQPVRAEIFPGLEPIMRAAKDGGAAAAYLSGGGSTVAALAFEGEERVARLMTQAAIAAGFSGRSIITRPTSVGAHVVEG